MDTQARVKFGTVAVARADIVADSTLLQLHLLDGVMNKHEVGMLIKLLQEKQEKMKAKE
jgi:hypothetical protein